MQYSQDHRHLDEPDRNWRREADADRVGPQGEALILELQRLRQALDGERGDGRHPPGSSGRGEARKRQAPRKSQPLRPGRKPKSTVKRAIDICLKPFGINTPIHAVGSSNPLVEPAVPPLHRHSPPIFQSDPVYMDLRNSVPDMAARENSPVAESEGERIVASAAPPNTNTKTNTAVAELIGKCRDGLMTGAAFILDRDGAAPPADGADDSLQT